MSLKCSDFVKYSKNRRFFPHFRLHKALKCLNSFSLYAFKLHAHAQQKRWSGMLLDCQTESLGRETGRHAVRRTPIGGERAEVCRGFWETVTAAPQGRRTCGPEVFCGKKRTRFQSKQCKGSRQMCTLVWTNNPLLTVTSISDSTRTEDMENDNNHRNLGLTWSPLALIAQPIHRTERSHLHRRLQRSQRRFGTRSLGRAVADVDWKRKKRKIEI